MQRMTAISQFQKMNLSHNYVHVFETLCHAMTIDCITLSDLFVVFCCWLKCSLNSAIAREQRYRPGQKSGGHGKNGNDRASGICSSVPSNFYSVRAEENGVWAAHFDAWAFQLSHFWKRQIKSKISGGDPEGSAGSTNPHFWELGLLYDFDPLSLAEIVVCDSRKISVSSTKCFYIWQPFPNSC